MVVIEEIADCPPEAGPGHVVPELDAQKQGISGGVPHAHPSPVHSPPAPTPRGGQDAKEPAGQDPFDNIDPDIRASVEKELGNEAYRRKDYDCALVHYTSALGALKPPHSDERTLVSILSNRAMVYIHKKEWESATADCRAVLAVDSTHSKAAYRLALALYRAGDLQGAVNHVDAFSGLSNEVDIQDIATRCRAELSAAEARAQVAKRAESARALYGPAVCRAGVIESPVGLLVVERLVAGLLSDDDVDDGGGGGDVDAASALEQLAHALEAGPDPREYFRSCNGYPAALFYLTEAFHGGAGAVLRAAAGGDPAGCTLHWPMGDLLPRLARESFLPGQPPCVAEEALGLLAFAAAGGREARAQWLAAAAAGGVLGRVVEAATAEETLPTLTPKGAIAVVNILGSFAGDVDSRVALAEACVRPLEALITLHLRAGDLLDTRAHPREAGLPEKLDQCVYRDEGLRWLARLRRRLHDTERAELRRRALEVAAGLARDGALLREEAFERRTTRGGAVKVAPSGLAQQLVGLLTKLVEDSPRKVAPVLDLRGKATSYEQRRYAADYLDNAFGDMLVQQQEDEFLEAAEVEEEAVAIAELGPIAPPAVAPGSAEEDQIVLAPEAGDLFKGDGRPSIPQELRGVTALERSLELIAAAASSRPVAKALFRSGALRALAPVLEFTTIKGQDLVPRLERAYQALASGCDAAAEEVLGSSGPLAAASGLLRCGHPPLEARAAARALSLVDSCPGGDFLQLCRVAGGLDGAYGTLCRLDSAGAGAWGAEERATHRAAGELFVRALERARKMDRLGPDRVPTWGAWGRIGREEVLMMEEKVTGKERLRAAPRGTSDAPRLSAAAGAAAPAARAGGKAGAGAGAAPVPGPGPGPEPAPAAARASRNPLPWDAPPPGGGSVGQMGQVGKAPVAAPPLPAVIKKGFFGPGARPSRTQREVALHNASTAIARRSRREAAAAAAEQRAARDGLGGAIAAIALDDGEDEGFFGGADGALIVWDDTDSEAGSEITASVASGVGRRAGARGRPAPFPWEASEEELDAERVAAAPAARGPAAPGQYDEDGLRVVQDSGGVPGGPAARASRVEWANRPLRDKLSWNQTTTEIVATVDLPRGTSRSEVEVAITTTRLTVRLHWYGKVLDGPLTRRVKAAEALWSLEGGQLEVMLPKDDTQHWRSLFEGGEEKSHVEVLQELIAADEPTQSYEDMDDDSRDLVDEIRERQQLLAEGLISLEDLDDFRCVLGDGDGA